MHFCFGFAINNDNNKNLIVKVNKRPKKKEFLYEIKKEYGRAVRSTVLNFKPKISYKIMSHYIIDEQRLCIVLMISIRVLF